MTLVPPPDGWTGWVGDPELTGGLKGKWRPFCRGRPIRGTVLWFPRTSKRPREGERFAVYSPAGQIDGLSKSGWFITNVFVRRAPGYRPEPARHLGVLPTEVLDAIYAKLARQYWDPGRFDAGEQA